MNSFIDDLIVLLEAVTYGTRNVDIFISSNANVPSGDGPFTSLRDTGGSAPSRVQNRRVGTSMPSAQLVVRGTDPIEARNKVFDAIEILDGKYNLTVAGTYYVSIRVMGEPVDQGLDGEARPMFSVNFEAECRRSSSTVWVDHSWVQ